MKLNDVKAVYFSPTGNSKKCALAAAEAIGRNITEIDMTKIAAFDKEIEFGINDFVVFAAPVYGGRLFKEFAEKISKLKGNLAKCAVIVTYGNRDYDDALLEFKNLLIEQNFVPLGFAAIVGRHTYGTIQVKRPDENDIELCHLLGKKVLEKIDSGVFDIPEVKGNIPYKNGGNGGSFYPSTNERCARCGACARLCPMDAISKDDYSVIDTEKCISCFRCIRRCLYGAKDMTTKDYREFAESFSERLKDAKESELFI